MNLLHTNEKAIPYMIQKTNLAIPISFYLVFS